MEVAGTAHFARWSNQHTLWNARRVAFYHPHDDPLGSLDNVGERESEMSAPNVDELIRAFARQQGRPSGLSQPSPPIGTATDEGKDV